MLNVIICRWRRFFIIWIGFVSLFFCGSTYPHVSAQNQIEKEYVDEQIKKKVAIVIDDFGNNMNGTTEMMALKIQFTAAVMPFLPTTHRDAEWAHSLGHDVIVHLPMEPIRGLSSWLGPGAITTSLSDAEIRTRVNAAIDDVPFAVGMNNHMGSKATADPRVMKVVLEVCHDRGLFFLDSRTNYKSVVSKLADQLEVRTLDNHIFLDDQYTSQHINKQVALIVTYLLKHDECVVIGHVGPSGTKTAAALNQASRNLADKLEFVSLLQMLSVKAQHKLDVAH
ncbi:divergent polysaccharide deacetylase family protein [Paenibacillus psychroresistens]|uniref:Divergent polysaccharide deacetylase family protein n=1 Tax=Paenibacillus psychroresistens TaxID=1778678 RepID=A0A6B8RJ59_9BACL|nr:divergent polysaccharide deacetylase family protein [Paenibacillus psychroresistens]QGQ95358.1 divergent polysaccharide deacetylase family protein [Paenibacillus psychroresistens]